MDHGLGGLGVDAGDIDRPIVLDVDTGVDDACALLLAARKTPGRQFIRYNAFAQKLGRLSRTYADKSLQMAAADLIDLYEAKTLDSDTLRAIAVTLFGITVSS